MRALSHDRELSLVPTIEIKQTFLVNYLTCLYFHVRIHNDKFLTLFSDFYQRHIGLHLIEGLLLSSIPLSMNINQAFDHINMHCHRMHYLHTSILQL